MIWNCMIDILIRWRKFEQYGVRQLFEWSKDNEPNASYPFIIWKVELKGFKICSWFRKWFKMLWFDVLIKWWKFEQCGVRQLFEWSKNTEANASYPFIIWKFRI